MVTVVLLSLWLVVGVFFQYRKALSAWATKHHDKRNHRHKH